VNSLEECPVAPPRAEEAMDLFEAIESNGTCRSYRADPVPAAMLARALDAARFAPSGGNRQPVRFVVVTDAGLREKLAALYLPRWEEYVRAMGAGSVRVNALPRGVQAADRFARNLARVPVLAVVCARLADCHATDQHLGRLTVVGGASIYPAVQNFLLACRAQGLGTALTTLLCFEEPSVKALLGIPDEIATVATIAVGWPERGFPKRLRRNPIDEFAFANRYGDPLAV
jgi:nitroreductase